MKILTKIMAVGCLVMLLMGNAYAGSEKFEFNPGYILDKMDVISYFTKPVKEELAKNKVDLDFLAGIRQGYDNNVFLNPGRKKDGFLQPSLKEDLTYRFTRDIRMFFDSDVSYVKYYKFNDNDLFDISINPGFEVDLLDDRLTLETDYLLDWVNFPHDDDGSIVLNSYSIFVKNNVIKQFYHKGGFRLEYRDYTSRKVFGSNEVKTDDLRRDVRYVAEYEAGMKIFANLKAKQVVKVYRNDSNDQYEDYYDYWAFSERTTLIAYLTDKLYGTTSLTYTHRWLDDRLSSKDSTHEKHDVFYFSTSLYYDLTPSFTLSASYTYRESGSNEPLQNYSGSIMSIGLYYIF